MGKIPVLRKLYGGAMPGADSLSSLQQMCCDCLLEENMVNFPQERSVIVGTESIFLLLKGCRSK